ncbi:MAG: hypothetical protein DCF20_14895 [Pseudanabaena sp.]|nr:MAG: hypothetical protein DCF20_14895 [Pseudanabaena sp.]
MDKIYDRQSTDTDKSFAAFAIYRDMGSDRTLEKVRVEIGHRSVRNLEAWCSKHLWVARCRAFDDDEWIDIDPPVVPTKKALKAGDKVRYVGQKFAAIYGSTELIVNSVGSYEIDCKLPDGAFTTKFKIRDRDPELDRASAFF